MEVKMKSEPVVKEITLETSPERIWKAITNKDDMKHWYFALESFKPEVGFEFQFSGGTEEESYLHLCRVTAAAPGRKLTYSWKYDGYPGESFVTFEIFPEGERTRLRLTHEGLETFPQDKPGFAKENFMEGWNQIIGTNLKSFLEKH